MKNIIEFFMAAERVNNRAVFEEGFGASAADSAACTGYYNNFFIIHLLSLPKKSIIVFAFALGRAAVCAYALGA